MRKVKKIVFVTIIFGLLVGIVVFGVIKTRTIAKNIRLVATAQDEFLSAVGKKDVLQIKQAIFNARNAIGLVAIDLKSVKIFSFLPGVKREMENGRQLLEESNYLLDSADLAINIAQSADVNPALENIDFTGSDVLRKIDSALIKNKTNILALAETGKILIGKNNSESKFGKIQSIRKKIKNYVVLAQQVAKNISASEDGLATLLGLRGEKHYLLLFENSDELRPGGGLISTYGLVTLKDGQTSDLFVDHVKNLKEFYTQPTEFNPEPIQQTMRHQKNLYIYDANWLGDPNAWLEKIYRSWNAQRPPVDGVIVMSTKFLEDIARQYGPIVLPGTKREFRAEDIVASLDYYFDVEHDLYDYSKYKVLGPLVEEMLKEIKVSNAEQWKEFLANVKKRFQSRDLFVYLKDQNVVGALKNNGIENELSVPVGDEFYALEASLGSGKADGRIKRSLALHVYAQEKQPVGIATITQDYSAGVDDFRAGGYYGYLRFFLPVGSKLGMFEKFDLVEDENLIEAGRQVYGNYFGVATGTKKEVSITYALANSVAEQIKNGSYSLTLRKQGGVEMPFEIKINIPDSWQNPTIVTSDGAVEFNKNDGVVVCKGILTKDMQIEIRK